MLFLLFLLIYKAILTLISELKLLDVEDNTFLKYLRNIAFIPNNLPTSNTRKLYKASDLFDPSNAELMSLLGKSKYFFKSIEYRLKDGQFFPFENFHTEEIISYLRGLGLKTALDLTGIIKCAKSIASADNSDRFKKRYLLLMYLFYMQSIL